MKKIMEILLLEDDQKLCNEFDKVIKDRQDIKLRTKTNSSIEALKLIKTYDYDAIIVDLELHYGTGSGLDFLKELKMLGLKNEPIIVVNTNIVSNIIYDNIHNGLADMIFYKKQKDYSPKLIIDSLLILKKDSNFIDLKEGEEIDNKDKRIESLINQQLDLIGISYKLKGREYIFEAIMYMLQNNINNNFSIFQYLASKHKLLTTSISKAIQTAINETWRTSCIEDLKENYTAKINYHTGVPTPTEFLYYYIDKIKKMI